MELLALWGQCDNCGEQLCLQHVMLTGVLFFLGDLVLAMPFESKPGIAYDCVSELVIITSTLASICWHHDALIFMCF